MKKILILFFIIINITTKAWCSEKIDVLYTIDENYAIPCLLSINSILLNNTSKNNYTFYIMVNDLSARKQDLMKKFIKKRNQNVVFIDIDTNFIKKFNYKSHNVIYLTPVAAARLYADRYLPKDINKVIYLDSDTLINTDLVELYNINLENNIAGLVLNKGDIPYSKDLYDFKNGYYNSGVILLDLKKCREEKCSYAFENYFTQNFQKFTINPNEKKEYFYLIDQDLISIIWDGKIKNLDKMWNIQEFNITSERGIIHYLGSLKPWLFKCNHKKNRIYLNYWDKTPEPRKYKHYYLLKSCIKNYITKTKHIINKEKAYYLLITSFFSQQK